MCRINGLGAVPELLNRRKTDPRCLHLILRVFTAQLFVDDALGAVRE
jgi:hypothetical protein